MFKVEIRDDAVRIDGYVNAVERDSKVLHDERGAFVEKVKSGAFQRAIDRAETMHQPIRVLLNHDYGRELTNTNDANTQLFEDSIGLRCQCEIRDADVIQKARDHKLRGWSFGFLSIIDSREDVNGTTVRELKDIELREVSLLDETKIPAYDGTSVEVRDFTETRDFEDATEFVEHEPEKTNIHEYEYRFNATRMA